jgi:hypothetical protein
MTTNLAYAPVRPIRSETPPQRQIAIAPVAVRRARPRVAYALAVVGCLFGIYLAQLMLSIALSQGAYEIASLQDQQKELLRTQNDLSQALDVLTSPQHLANNAIALGMIPGESPAYLRLSDGSVTAAPAAHDSIACGASCDLVANALLTGVPLVSKPAPGAPATPAAGSATNATPAGNAPVSQPVGLPSPQTH